MKRYWTWFGFVALLFALWGGALTVRRAVLAQQTRSLQGEEPLFLKESALQFRMTRLVAETGTLPVHDPMVGVPEGVDPRKTYSVGAEWIYSWLSSLLPGEMSFAARLRWVSAALFCLAIPAAFLWIFLRTGSVLGGLVTAGILIASPAFAVRSSGLELSRENLAFPLMLGFMAVQSLVARKTRTTSKAWGLAGLAALFLVLAQCFWDLTQYLTGLWVVFGWARELWKRDAVQADERRIWVCVTVGLVLASLVNPYLRSHGFIFSPVLGLLLGRCVLWGLGDRAQKHWVRVGVGLCVLGLWYLAGRLFVENYSHFGELLLAKLQHGNVKPMDPAPLTVVQRMMWTPALNSATWSLTNAYFTVTLWFSIPVAVWMWIHRPENLSGWTPGRTEAFPFLFTLSVYVLFFRFHVFLILFAAQVLGCAVAWLQQSSSRRAGGIAGLIALLFFPGLELHHLLFFDPAKADPQQQRTEVMRKMMLQQMGIADPMSSLPDNRWAAAHKLEYPMTQDLLQALNEQLPEVDTFYRDAPKEAVLANFGISGTVLTYVDMPILLHPKFETPGIRDRVAEFYRLLYRGSERELRDWAVAEGARYYLHRKGSLEGKDMRNHPAYMVDALEPGPDSSWAKLEQFPEQLEWFIPLPVQTGMYRLYRIVSPDDLHMARELTALARDRYMIGDYVEAENWAMQALTYHWKFLPAQEVLAKARSRRSQ